MQGRKAAKEEGESALSTKRHLVVPGSQVPGKGAQLLHHLF